MKRSDIFPSQYLKCADLQGRHVTVVIDHARTERLQDGDKLVIFFQNKTKSLVCNATNFDAIVKITGIADTDDWPGQEIMLVPQKVAFKGTMVDAIRIEAPQRRPAPPQQPAPRPAAPRPSTDDMDDEIPF